MGERAYARGSGGVDDIDDDGDGSDVDNDCVS